MRFDLILCLPLASSVIAGIVADEQKRQYPPPWQHSQQETQTIPPGYSQTSSPSVPQYNPHNSADWTQTVPPGYSRSSSQAIPQDTPKNDPFPSYPNVTGDAYTPYSVQTPPLDTPWTYSLGTNPWPEYPRPQLQRSNWQNLNGIWRYRNATNGYEAPPFGIQGNFTIFSWLQTTFTVPSNWANQRVLLNFGAVDYEATVYVNGQQVGSNRGGYFRFTIDVTDYVSLSNGTNELLVFVYDPTDTDDVNIPVGKQTLRPSHIFYTPCSGIWQSVWIEAAPQSDYITQLDLSGDMDGQVTATVHTASQGQEAVEITVYEKNSSTSVASFEGTTNTQIQFSVQDADLWSPDSPTLYDVTVTLSGGDSITSYMGFRTISSGYVNGIMRPLLNGEFVFPFGTLDQGFWPDGIYTPPNREAMVFDLQTLKGLGFNMLRKHIKVENALFYQACDEMGVMLIQDMPSLRALQSYYLPNCTEVTYLPNEAEQAEFVRQLQLLVEQHKSYPSIFAWVIYNEGWGQLEEGYPEFALTDLVRSLDPTRLISSTSGWNDHGAGDFSDNHHYANPQCGTPFYSTPSSPHDPSRIALQGEFGGVGHNTTLDHLWKVADAFNAINETYEIDETLQAWNYRAHRLLDELREQVELFECSGGVWTQTTDVEGEVNGLLTYDRRVLRTEREQWRRDIGALYEAARGRGNGNGTMGML